MNPTLTAQNGNILKGTLPTNVSGFTPTGDVIYNTTPKAPVGSAVVTSAPAAESYKQSAAWIANEQNQAAVRAANAKLAEQQAAAANAAAAGKNRTTQVAVDALSGFKRTGQGDELTAGEQARVNEINQIGSQLKELAVQMDARASAQIDSVIKEYESLAKRQEVANAAYEGGTSTAGLVSGRSRYAPEIQAGVQSAAVASGIQALTDLQMKKQKLIMEIEQARDAQQYKALTDRVQELKSLQKEERQAAQDMKDNFYKEQTYMRENAKYVGQTLAPQLVSSLTGDPATDNTILQSVAEQNGVSVAALASAVDQYKQDLKKAEPNFLQEYNLAKSQGFKGTYLQFKNASSGSSGSKNTISASDARAFGLPVSFVGMDESTFINSLGSSKVPSWYKQIAEQKTGGQPLTESALVPLWNEFRQPLLNNPVGGDAGGLY